MSRKRQKKTKTATAHVGLLGGISREEALHAAGFCQGLATYATGGSPPMTTELGVRRIAEIYRTQCAEAALPFEFVESVATYDDSTLFCPAGMQRYKPKFRDMNVTGETVSNIQTCIRLTDFDLVGDGTHSIAFGMIGLFSFRDWPMGKAIDFFHEFVRRCGVNLCHVTVHPDKLESWKNLHPQGVTVKADQDCKWSDGEIGGYCTEFYALDKSGAAVEIGNVVNPLGNCVDVGFGLERMDAIANGTPPRSKCAELARAATAIIASGITPGNTQQGYVLRKILRRLDKAGGNLEHAFFRNEQTKRIKAAERYRRLLPKHADKSPAWWWETHGITVGEDT